MWPDVARGQVHGQRIWLSRSVVVLGQRREEVVPRRPYAHFEDLPGGKSEANRADGQVRI